MAPTLGILSDEEECIAKITEEWHRTQCDAEVGKSPGLWENGTKDLSWGFEGSGNHYEKRD